MYVRSRGPTRNYKMGGGVREKNMYVRRGMSKNFPVTPRTLFIGIALRIHFFRDQRKYFPYHICSFIFFPPNSTVLILKSMPENKEAYTMHHESITAWGKTYSWGGEGDCIFTPHRRTQKLYKMLEITMSWGTGKKTCRFSRCEKITPISRHACRYWDHWPPTLSKVVGEYQNITLFQMAQIEHLGTWGFSPR